MKSTKRKGFTVVELVTVLVIIGILSAIAIPSLVMWRRHAEFRKDESYARTLYLTMQAGLTASDNAGTLDKLMGDITAEGSTAKKVTGLTDAGGEPIAGDRIYGVVLDSNKRGEISGIEKEVYDILERYTYDATALNSSIVVEFDVKAKTVYSVFSATWQDFLTYDSFADGDSRQNNSIDKRDPATRKERIIGYYSVEDAVNVVSYTKTRLRITRPELINSEELKLKWSGNVADPAVEYKLTFFESDTSGTSGKKLFETTVGMAMEAAKNAEGKVDISAGGAQYQYVTLTLTDENKILFPSGTEKFCFPVEYAGGTFTLILDAMMSAQDVENIGLYYGADAKWNALNGPDWKNSLSITRLGLGVQDFLVKVQALPTTGTTGGEDSFTKSKELASDPGNTMYGAGSMLKEENGEKSWQVGIAYYRHLYNIRWLENYDADAAKTYTQKAATGSEMVWNNKLTTVYFSKQYYTKLNGGAPTDRLWMPVHGDSAAFPTVPELGAKSVYEGKDENQKLTGLKLTTLSVPQEFYYGGNGMNRRPDASRTGAQADARYYLGLFGIVRGTVQKITLDEPTLVYKQNEDKTVRTLYGAGLISGVCTGKICNVAVTSKAATTENAPPTVDAVVSYSSNYFGGVGGITGVLATDAADNTNRAVVGLRATESGEKSSVSMQGTVKGVIENGYALPTLQPAQTKNIGPAESGTSLSDSEHAKPRSGVGGVVGFVYNADIGCGNAETGTRSTVLNEADVTGNLLVGGVVGSTDKALPSGGNTYPPACFIVGVSNTGLVTCSANDAVAAGATLPTDKIQGYYTGGIVGYTNGYTLKNCVSTAGASTAGSYKGNEEQLKGKYVGGIVGYCYNTNIDSTCKTGAAGYILGGEEVGGIAGGAGGDKKTGDTKSSVTITTTNASYVVGKINVGGIVGSNTGFSLLQRCTNSAIVAATVRNAGGIVGMNVGEIVDCTSTVYSYNNTLFDTLKSWKAYGDNVGGIVGYNNGTLSNSELQYLAPMVMGGKCVGGIIGFNGPDGNVTFAGRGVYKYTEGHVVGGAATGMNNEPSGYVKQEDPKDELTVNAPYHVGYVKKADGEEDETRPIYLPYGSKGDYVGGVVGYNMATELFTNSFTAVLAEVTGHDYVGGLVGCTHTTGDATLNMELSTGRDASLGVVTGSSKVGGLIGSLRHDYVSGENSTGGIVEIIGTNQSEIGRNYMNVNGWRYVGGLIGYVYEDAEPEKTTTLKLTDCINYGSINPPATIAAPESIPLTELLGLTDATTEDYKEVEPVSTYCVGGIVGYNNTQSTLLRCTNSGSVVSGSGAVGGLVGVNKGNVYNSTVSSSVGSSSSNIVGGIVGVNAGTVTGGHLAGGSQTIMAAKHVGGLVGINLNKAALAMAPHEDSGNGTADYTLEMNAIVTCTGDDAGGLVGWNNGTVTLNDTKVAVTGSVRGENDVGGAIGWAASHSQLKLGNKDVTNAITINGTQYVGGIFGRFAGEVDSAASKRLVNKAAVVAQQGFAGGIAGEAVNSIAYADNTAQVQAIKGDAGGITARNNATVSDSTNIANVIAQNGSAGGIVAVNKGTITACIQKTPDSGAIRLESNKDYLGGIAAQNEGTVGGCTVTTQAQGMLTFAGSAATRGGLVGLNTGTVNDGIVNGSITLIAESALAENVGGAVGVNRGRVDGSKNDKNSNISLNITFRNVKYVGGVVGNNNGTLANYNYTKGTLKDNAASRAGDSLGGIAGSNGGKITNCNVDTVTVQETTGMYAADTTNIHTYKDSTSSHVAGIAGRNEKEAVIERCVLTGTNNLSATNGGAIMGGVAGYNEGKIDHSGSPVAENSIIDETNLDALDKGSTDAYKAFGLTDDVTTISMNGGTSAPMGGIAGLNGPDGNVSFCANGSWSIATNSGNADASAGGIIGMNEAEGSQTNLLNFADITRMRSNVAGGIIGRQENRTTQDSTLTRCINFGKVTITGGDRAGGIIGAWKYMGGYVTGSRNYGELSENGGKNNYMHRGGIVSALYYMNTNQTVNILGCRNASNDVDAGMLTFIKGISASIYTTVNITDCVNLGTNKQAGIYLCADSGTNANYIRVNIAQCRNYGTITQGKNSGIVDTNSAVSIVLTDCFDFSGTNKPLAGGGTNMGDGTGDRDYYVDNSSFVNALTTYDDGKHPMTEAQSYIQTYTPYWAKEKGTAFADSDNKAEEPTETKKRITSFSAMFALNGAFTGSDTGYRMSFNSGNKDVYKTLSIVMELSKPAAITEFGTAWYTGVLKSGQKDRTYEYSIDVMYQGNTAWTLEAVKGKTTEDSSLFTTSMAQKGITTENLYRDTIDTKGKLIEKIRLNVLNAERYMDDGTKSYQFVSIWNFTPFAGSTPINAEVKNETIPVVAGLNDYTKETLYKGERLYLLTDEGLNGTGSQKQYFCRMYDSTYRSGTAKNHILQLKTSEDGANCYLTLQNGKIVGYVLLAAEKGNLTAPLESTTKITDQEPTWQQWEAMVQDWYKQTVTINAPKNLSTAPGQTYTFSWDENGSSTRAYYVTELYVFEDEAAANEAKADLSLLSNPAVTKYTYSKTKISSTQAQYQTQVTLQSSWPGKFFIVRTRAEGASQQSDWCYADGVVQKFVTALDTPTVKGELMPIEGSFGYMYRVDNRESYAKTLKDAIADMAPTTENTVLTDGNLYWKVNLAQAGGAPDTATLYYESPKSMKSNTGADNMTLSMQALLLSESELEDRLKALEGEEYAEEDLTIAKEVLAYLSGLYGPSENYTTMSNPLSGVTANQNTQLNKSYGINAPTLAVTGSTADTMTLTATIERKNSNAQGAATYAVDLVKKTTTKGPDDTTTEYEIIQSKNVVIVGANSVAFSNIPQELLNPVNTETVTTELYVRARAVQCALGPLYYYCKAENKEDANLIFAPGVLYETENEREQQTYYKSVLLNSEDPLKACEEPVYINLVKSVNAADAVHAIPAPTGLGASAKLSAETLGYNFAWTKPDISKDSTLSSKWQEKYTVVITGYNGEVATEIYNYTDVVAGSDVHGAAVAKDGDHWLLTLTADSWNYDSLQLTVTPTGGKVNGTQYVGLSAQTDKIPAQKRLAAPGMPLYTVTDFNEMLYRITWAKSSDDAAASNPVQEYEVRIKGTDANGNEIGSEVNGEPVKYVVLRTVTATGAENYAAEAVDMSLYEGAKLTLYVVARPTNADSYYPSPDGVSTAWEVPKRLDMPVVQSWLPQWNASPQSYLPSAFRAGALVQQMLLDKTNSANQEAGINTYVSKAWLYPSVLDEQGKPVLDKDAEPMEVAIAPMTENGDAYHYTATYELADNEQLTANEQVQKYAGGWLVPAVRATRGGKISSNWTADDLTLAERLPDVTLETPAQILRDVERTYVAKFTVEGTEQTNSSVHSAYTTVWNQAADSLTENQLVTLQWMDNDVQRVLPTIEGEEPSTPETATATTTVLKTEKVVATEESNKKTTTYNVQKWVGEGEPDPDAGEENWQTLTPATVQNEDGSITYTYTAEIIRISGESAKVMDNNETVFAYTVDMPAQLVIRVDSGGAAAFTTLLPDPVSRLFSDEEQTPALTNSVKVVALPGSGQNFFNVSAEGIITLHDLGSGASLLSLGVQATPESGSPQGEAFEPVFEPRVSTGESALWAVLGLSAATPRPGEEARADAEARAALEAAKEAEPTPAAAPTPGPEQTEEEPLTPQNSREVSP